MKNKGRLTLLLVLSLSILILLGIYSASVSSKKEASSRRLEDSSSISATESAVTYPQDRDGIIDQIEVDYSQDTTAYSSPGVSAKSEENTSPVSVTTDDSFTNEYSDSSYNLEVHFIDVGQGDATLLISDGESMLIDAGDSNQGTKIQSYLLKQGISELKYLFLTHPDSDHIGGAPVIITKFNIGTVFISGYQRTDRTNATERLQETLNYKYISPVIPSLGDNYTLGSCTIKVIGPTTYQCEEQNDASIALLVQCGNNRFIFTGDAEAFEEYSILAAGIDIKADVYKVGHHGSSSSTSDRFLRAIMPSYAVISCGRGNSYGHPHSETLQKLNSIGAAIYRTDESGNIIATSDGNTIKWNVQSSYTEAPVSYPDPVVSEPENTTPASQAQKYYINTNNGYFHKEPCKYIYPDANPNTHYWVEATREELINKGYRPCTVCNP